MPLKVTAGDASRFLGDAEGDKRFWCCDGRVFQNLSELHQALKEMSEDTFRYHSGPGKSDFSNWVRDVIGDQKLAGDLAKASSRAQAVRAVGRRLYFLRSKI